MRVVAVLGVLVWCASAGAQGKVELPADLETGRGMALGTGMRAAARSTSAVAYNPANLPLGGLYHIDAFADYHAKAGRWSVGGTVADSMINSNIAMGLSFRGVLDEGDGGYSGYDGRLAIGLPLSDQVSIGVSGRYVRFVQEGDQGDRADGDKRATGFTMNGAIRVNPIPTLSLVAIAENFIDLKSELTPVRVGGSAALDVGSGLTLGADVLFDLTTFDKAKPWVGGGIEFLAGGKFPLRAGYAYDGGRKVHGISGGLGYVDQQVGVDVGVSQQVSGGSVTRLLLSARYFIH